MFRDTNTNCNKYNNNVTIQIKTGINNNKHVY